VDFNGIYMCKFDGVDILVLCCVAVRRTLTLKCTAALLLVGVSSGNILFATFFTD
jgi:hypothetical protein